SRLSSLRRVGNTLAQLRVKYSWKLCTRAPARMLQLKRRNGRDSTVGSAECMRVRQVPVGRASLHHSPIGRRECDEGQCVFVLSSRWTSHRVSATSWS